VIATGRRTSNEYSMDKQTKLREMVAYAIQKGQRFDYLLVDSWFTCKELVHFVKRRHFNCHLLGMIKMGNTKYRSGKYGDIDSPHQRDWYRSLIIQRHQVDDSRRAVLCFVKLLM
jgi:predicted nucleic acid-binding Zn finger protein